MKFPKIRQQANMTVTVPGLSGGINAHDTVSTVDNHQLTDADNMWWRGAVLKTRPGMRDTGERYDVAFDHQQWVSDREVLLYHSAYNERENRTEFYAAEMTQDSGFRKLGTGALGYHGKPTADKTAPTAFGCRAPKKGSEDADGQADHYFFLSSGEIIQENKQETEPTEGCGFVSAEPYVPTITIYGGGDAVVANGGTSGRAYEAPNMLTGAFRCTYQPDGNSTIYTLPYDKLTHNEGEKVTVTCTLANLETYDLYDYTFEFDPDEVTSDSMGQEYAAKSLKIDPYCISVNTANIQGANIVCRFHWRDGYFSLYISYTDISGTGEHKTISIPRNEHDVIAVTAWKTDNARRDTICKMTQAVWFGCSQLFVCGNPEKINLVYWSDIQNPLYFPENNYVYIGDYFQRVTAMRPQGDLLAVFQEHQLHGMTYSIASDDAYDLAKESNTEAVSIAVQVAAVSLHSAIGCDCPGSIRLVNNRLVWATSDGKVYMLPSVNQYNERNVREISRNIFAVLSKHGAETLKRSFSGDFGGYYVLLVENHMYLLDAQTSAFSSFNYYAKEESAQKALPWFRWTLPAATYTQVMANDTVMHLCVYADGIGKVYAMDGDTDDGVPIPCSFTTKLFDFDRHDKRKAVMQMYIGIGDSPASETALSYITEQDVYDDAWTMESYGDHDEREAGFMRVHRLTPNISRTRVFGFRCDSVGAISVGTVIIKFKEQGVVR